MSNITGYKEPRAPFASSVEMNLKNIPLQECEILSNCGKNPDKWRGYLIKFKDKTTAIEFDLIYKIASEAGILKQAFKKTAEGFILKWNKFGYSKEGKLIMTKN